MLKRRVFVVGGHTTPFIGKGHPNFVWKKHPDFGKRENPGLDTYITNSIQGALRDTQIDPSVIEKAWIGNFAGELFSNQGHLGAAVAGALPEFRHLPVMRVEGACASGGLAFASAVESIQAGTDIALACGAEVQTTVSARQGGDYLARAAHYSRQREIDDFTFPALFAQRMKHYREKYTNVSEEDIARLSVKAYSNGNKNPLAHMQTVKLTLNDAATASDSNPQFLSNPELKPFLKTSDCSQVSDGGSALIVVSEEGLRRIGKKPSDAIEVLSVSVAADNLYQDSDPTVMTNTAVAVKRALDKAQLRIADINVGEVHDCFSIAEILMYEAMGLAPQGQGTRLVKEGYTNIDGKLPINTGGGLIAFGHPVGATGVKQVLEIYRQMKGKCGDYQVPKSNPLGYGICVNMGGDDKTCVASTFKNL